MAQSSRALASPRPSSSACAAQPPSRQSNRIITPVKTHANYVRPNHDSQRSLARSGASTSDDNQTSVTQSQNNPARPKTASNTISVSNSSSPAVPSPTKVPTVSKPKPKKRKRKELETGSNPDASTMDLVQISDEENEKALLLEGKAKEVL
ncbi:hypothetical protein PtA15_15A274 [Puccinia triticina]|uniref:Uncharacterized protein n=1 Tax=Puccinia triticina TaxID=208348 RepID=A0ABY7D5C4_9BASI|nr:uncharacterized protein PtA15_15A274 [Puccinia triticina]WAQ91882.1 hypothetical protein PtA15_15A274 [Puccinia triticina]